MRKIVFICTGNTCRSPMAMAFFNHLAAAQPPEFGFTAISAGLSVSWENLPSKNAVQVMQDGWGFDITGHRAHTLTRSEVEEAHLLLTMEHIHKDSILSAYPEARRKVFTLKEYAYTSGNTGSKMDDRSGDVCDPYGYSIGTYRHCAQEIREAVEKVVEKLKKN
jgi:protein-tyrosine phosphatase